MPDARSEVAALIVAAGRGSRAGGGAVTKQYVELGGSTVLARTLAAFLAAPGVDCVQVVIHADDRTRYDDSVATLTSKPIAGQQAHVVLLAPVAGGATRQASVLAGLEALERRSTVGHVLIHDAARPFVDTATIERVLRALDGTDAVIAALPVVDTLKRADATGRVRETVDRDGLWRAQTPQAFRLALALDMHRRARAAARDDFTDDAAIAEWLGLPVSIVAGNVDNTKLTTAEDMAEARHRFAGGTMHETRTGQGFDVHRFKAGDHVWLCGLKIPHSHALDGHSDADVALHALTDALLGAIGDGDIGQHFPPTDPKWKGAASDQFLADAARRVHERGGRIVNVDLTILCEAPRIGPHRDAMRARIAEILAIETGRIGVKATTTEQLGFTGRREGVAAMAVASIALPTTEPGH